MLLRAELNTRGAHAHAEAAAQRGHRYLRVEEEVFIADEDTWTPVGRLEVRADPLRLHVGVRQAQSKPGGCTAARCKLLRARHTQ